MSFELSDPVLIVGVGGVGSKIATKASKLLNSSCLIVSNDQNDLPTESHSIHISTKPILNPSIHLIRGFAMQSETHIRNEISKYSTIIIMANLAGKSGAAMAPVISQICKESNKNILSFAVMPFKYEKDRIFNSGISLKRLQTNSDCTVVIDNDAFLDSNPNLSAKVCYEITNSAIIHVINSLKGTSIHEETHMLTSSKEGSDLENSLKDSMKMLYESTPPNNIKRSIMYVMGGENAPIGIINTISNLSRNVLNEEGAQVDMEIVSSNESKVVMLSSIQGETKFHKYDPLGTIPNEDTLDWEETECSINCELDLYQLE